MTFYGKMLATAMVVGSLTAAGSAQAQAQPAQAQTQIQVSRKAQPSLFALQEAVKANDATKIPAAVAAAEAAAQTKEDRFTLGQLQVKAGLAIKDDALVARGSNNMLTSGLATPEQIRIIRTSQAQSKYQAKDYAGAVTDLQTLIASDPQNTDAMVLLAEAYENLGQSQQAVATFQKAIVTKQAANQPVPSVWGRRAVSIAYNHKLPTLTATTLAWIKTDPTPANIRDAARIIGDSSGLSDADQIDLFRLQHRAGALKGESDYYRYANTASLKGFPGEVKTVLDQGFAAGAISKSRPVFTSVYTSSSSKVASDKATLATTEKNGLAAATARQALTAGDVFLGYGDYAKAAGLYRAALGKSGADANIINLRLGEALSGSGDKAGALDAFAKVTGPQQATAQLWSAWVASR